MYVNISFSEGRGRGGIGNASGNLLLATANINLIAFGLTRPDIEPTNYQTRDSHSNYHTINAVCAEKSLKIPKR